MSSEFDERGLADLTAASFVDLFRGIEDWSDHRAGERRWWCSGSRQGMDTGAPDSADAEAGLTGDVEPILLT